MSRQTRLILILAGMAVVGVATLGFMAERFSRVARQSPETEPSKQAARAARDQVGLFVRARTVLRDSVESAGLQEMSPGPRVMAFARARDRALSAVRMKAADYREMREHYRQWNDAPSRLDAVWRAALEHHAKALRDCDLGELEDFDR